MHEIKYDARQPRDDHGKWSDGSGGISVGHALHVMKHEGIADEKQHDAVRRAINSGQHKTREDVLKHIDAIHASKSKDSKSFTLNRVNGGDQTFSKGERVKAWGGNQLDFRSGELVGISHAREKARVRHAGGKDGHWESEYDLGAIYKDDSPTPETPKPKGAMTAGEALRRANKRGALDDSEEWSDSDRVPAAAAAYRSPQPQKKRSRKSEEFGENTMIDTLVSFGGEIKSVEETATGWKFGGWLVCFDTHDVSSLRDRFTKSTDFDIQDGDRRSLYYNHGLDGTIKRTRMGDCHVSVKDAGVWIDGEIKKREDYLKKHAESIAVNIKRFGLSSGAPAHLVDRERVAGGHEVKMWPIAEASITPTPAEPMTGCFSLKALLEAEEAEASPTETDETKTTEITEDGPLAGLSFADHSEQVLAANAELLDRAKTIIDLRCIKAGRVLSSANCSRIESLVDSLQPILDNMRALLEEHGPQDEAEPEAKTAATEALNAEIDDLEIAFLQQSTRLSELYLAN